MKTASFLYVLCSKYNIYTYTFLHKKHSLLTIPHDLYTKKAKRKKVNIVVNGAKSGIVCALQHKPDFTRVPLVYAPISSSTTLLCSQSFKHNKKASHYFWWSLHITLCVNYRLLCFFLSPSPSFYFLFCFLSLLCEGTRALFQCDPTIFFSPSLRIECLLLY